MDDERKKFPRKARPVGGRPAGDGAKRGGEKPRPRPSGKPGFKPRPLEADGGKGGERKPRRDFGSTGTGDGPRKPFGDKKPFRKDAGGDRRRPSSPLAGEIGQSRRPNQRSEKPASREPRETAAQPDGERIAKRLARAGIASRRDAEELIAAGRVSVNGRALASPAVNVLASDQIMVDGTLIPPIERTRLFLFNKPAGLVTTNRDPEGRKTVFDVLPKDLPRLMTIGRLDINTEGLLLLTNDGGLARVLELPSTGWLRRYRVRVHGKVDEQALAGLREGIAVNGVFYGAIEATLDREQGSNAWLTLGLREGKNREVKNILGSLGLDVTRLIRISYGPFQLGELEDGAVQELKGRMLRDQLGERLIEEAGADFEAPVVKPFSNRPVVAGEEPVAKPERIFAGPPNRKREREDKRENALGRLSTTRPGGFKRGPGGGKGAGRKEKDEERRYEPPRPRGANVWMAPGARPQGKKREETPGEGRAAESRSRGKRQNVPSSGASRRVPEGEKRQSRALQAPRAPREGGKPNGPPHGERKPGGGPGKGPRRGGGADRRR